MMHLNKSSFYIMVVNDASMMAFIMAATIAPRQGNCTNTMTPKQIVWGAQEFWADSVFLGPSFLSSFFYLLG